MPATTSLQRDKLDYAIDELYRSGDDVAIFGEDNRVIALVVKPERVGFSPPPGSDFKKPSRKQRKVRAQKRAEATVSSRRRPR